MTPAEALDRALATVPAGRARVFDGVCENGHHAVELFHTELGPVVRFRENRSLATSRERELAGHLEVIERNHGVVPARRWRYRHDRGQRVVLSWEALLEAVEGDELGHYMPVWCRCAPDNVVHLTEIIEHIRAGRRRGVLKSYSLM